MNVREWFTVGLLIGAAVVGTVVRIDPAVPIGMLTMAMVIVRTVR